jgi:signal recognition particle GTPase
MREAFMTDASAVSGASLKKTEAIIEMITKEARADCNIVQRSTRNRIKPASGIIARMASIAPEYMPV